MQTAPTASSATLKPQHVRAYWIKKSLPQLPLPAVSLLANESRSRRGGRQVAGDGSKGAVDKWGGRMKGER